MTSSGTPGHAGPGPTAPRPRLSPRASLARPALDLALLLIAILLARWLRVVLPFGRPLDAEGSALHAPMVLLAVLLWALSLIGMGVYRSTGQRDSLAELQLLAAAITVAALVYAGLLYLSYRGLSRLLFGYLYVLDLGITCAAHLLWRWRDQRRGSYVRRVAIIGASPAALALADQLRRQTQGQMEVVGCLADAAPMDSTEQTQLAVLGTVSDAPAIVEAHRIQELVIDGTRPSHETAELLEMLRPLPVGLTLVPDTTALVLSRARMETAGDLLLIAINAPVIDPLDRALKRTMDVALSVLGLVILSPLLALLAAAIWLESGRPICYMSRRLGEGERPFRMAKFRTMAPEADRGESDLITLDAEGRVDFAKRADDPRITPLGRFLRRWSLDELPQLINVLRGEMSLVGPRPELPELAAHYTPWQRRRFGVPQGMTGWWQVSGRSALPKAMHVEDDLYYIRNYSLLLDLEILWRTIPAVLRGRGAY